MNINIVTSVFFMKYIFLTLLILCGNFLFACCDGDYDDCSGAFCDRLIVTRCELCFPPSTKTPPPSPVDYYPSTTFTQENIEKINKWLDDVASSRGSAELS